MTVICAEVLRHDLYKDSNYTMKEQLKKMNSQTSAIYGMAFIGALIYFIQHAHTFWEGALSFVKALVWPAILIYKLLEFLKM